MRLLYLNILLLVFVFPAKLHSLTVGSDTAVSRISTTPTFVTGAADNKILGFGALEGGFILQDSQTTCTYDCYFPISGDITMNDGYLYLNKDLTFKYPTTFLSGGKFYGQGHTIYFSSGINDIQFPDTSGWQYPVLVNQKTVGSSIGNISWSSDGKYFAVGSNAANELQIFYMTGNTVTLTVGISISGASVVNDVRWHPTLDYIAICKNNTAGADNFVYRFNRAITTLTLTYSVDDARNVTAVAWHPSGNFLAVGYATASHVQIYPFYSGGGVLGAADVSYTFSNARAVSKSSLSWQPVGDYLAVGTAYLAANPYQVLAFYFDGATSLTLAASFSAGTSGTPACTALAWHPTLNYVAAGLTGGTERLRLLKFYTESPTLFDLSSAYVAEAKTIRALNWRSAGDRLGVGLDSGVSGELKSYIFYSATESFSAGNNVEVGQNVYAAQYSPADGSRIAFGDATGRIFIYGIGAGLFFDNVNLMFDQNVTLRGITSFGDYCLINSMGNDLIISDSGGFDVKPTSSLGFENSLLNIRRAVPFSLEAFNSKVHFNNCRMVMETDVVFPIGSFEVTNKLDLTGFCTFYYTSEATSTINAFSSLNVGQQATLSFGRLTPESPQPLDFVDQTSELNFNDATLHITSTGVQLTKGEVNINEQANFSIDSTLSSYGLILGDGTAVNNLCLRVASGSDWVINSGMLVLNQEQFADNRKILFNAHLGRIYFKNGSTILFKYPFDLRYGELAFECKYSLSFDNAAYLVLHATNYTLTDEAFSSQITGTFTGPIQLDLGDNDIFLLLQGQNGPNILIKGQHAEILGNGVYQGQITLQDENAEMHWDINSNLVNNVLLNGGTIVLNRDMDCYGVVGFPDFGTVDLVSQELYLQRMDCTQTGSIYWDGSSGGIIKLNSQVSLSSTWTFSKDVIIEGNNRYLDLEDSGAIVVERGSTLTLKDITIRGVSGNKLRCLDDSGRIILNNVVLEMNGNYTFDKGALEFYNDFFLSGGYTFSYDSAMTSTVHTDSDLFMGGRSVLYIGRKTATSPNQPLDFETVGLSNITFDYATLAVNPFGLTIKNGYVYADVLATFTITSNDPDYGLRFGTGVSGEDGTLIMRGGAEASVVNGAIVYNDFSPSKFFFTGLASIISLRNDSKLHVLKNLSLQDGSLRPNSYSSIVISPGVELSCTNLNNQTGTAKYDLTGSYTSLSTIKLTESSKLNLTEGTLEKDIWAASGKSYIVGYGKFANDIFLQDSTVTLSMGVVSDLHADINLRGGNLNLEHDLKFADDHTVNGSGKINFNGNSLLLGGKDYDYSTPLIFDNAGDIVLNSVMSLSNKWTFTGVSNLNGNGNILYFDTGGKIFVANDSTLYLTDIVLRGLNSTADQFVLGNGGSQVRMSNVIAALDDDFSTTSGGIYIEGPATFILKDHTWTFNQAGSLTVDGMTLWKDGLQNILCGNVSFGTPLANYLTLLNSGTIKQLANEDLLIVDTTNLNIRITNTMNDIWSQYLTTSAYLDTRITNTMNNIWSQYLTTSVYLDNRITSSVTYLDVKISNTMNNIWSQYLTTSAYLDTRITNTMNNIWSNYLTTSAYFDSRITITMNDVWEDILTTSLNYDSRVTNLESSVFGISLNNASGNKILSQDKGVDFTAHPSLALSLTLSNESIIYLAGQDTELKLSDTIYVVGRNNIINVQKRFTINGLINFEEGSELIFNFDDKYENPIVYFGKNLTLSELSRLTFVNKGTALFKDGTTIQFNSLVDANRPALVVSNDATLMIDEKLSGHSESSLTLRGLGIISILNGEIFIDSLKHLIVGGGDTTTDRFDIYGDSGGALSLLGIGSKVSLHKAYINMDFRQSGILYIGQNGIFEINSLDQVASAGTLNNFKFTLNGELWIYDDGKFILGDNSSDSVINLNTTGASIGGYGVLQYLTSSSYSGRLYENNRKDVSVTAKNLIATLLQRSTNLLVSTLFLDKDGNYKVRLGNGVVASLLSGDNVLFDNPSNYFVYGTNGGRSFSIDASGNRS